MGHAVRRVYQASRDLPWRPIATRGTFDLMCATGGTRGDQRTRQLTDRDREIGMRSVQAPIARAIVTMQNAILALQNSRTFGRRLR